MYNGVEVIIMKKIITLTTPEQIKTFSDPYRVQIMFSYKKFNRPATVKEIADSMGETPAKVHYHVKKMLQAGILKLSHTKEIKGIIAKYYELTADSFSIECDKTNPQITKLFKNELQRTISSIYDESKRIVLNAIENIENIQKENENDNDSTSDFTLSNIYLTDEEAKELRRIIKEFSDKDKNKNDKEGLKEFHFFSALFSMESDSDIEAGE